MKSYKHTQISYIILLPLAGSFLSLLGLFFFLDFNLIFLAVSILIFVCLILFYSLTVMIEKGVMNISFGIGIIQKKFLLSDVQICQVVKNPWYYGWGIHLTPDGWLYNVSGTKAVRLVMKNGKKYRIGTDEPEELLNVIQNSKDV